MLGTYLRGLYLNSSSSSYIPGISSDLFATTQFEIRADAGDEGGVIYDSAMSTMQGLYPATSSYQQTLANGSVIVGPLGGYQYVPIESVDSNNDISLEGWTSCATFETATEDFYASAYFKQKAEESTSFLSALSPYLGGRSVALENMWNIYDFVNVQSIHNATFANNLPPTFLAQARDLANWHEYNVFSSPDPDAIENIAIRPIIPYLVDYVQRIANGSSSNPLKIAYNAISYKPFLSLFNITGAAEMNPALGGIVNYAASVAFEVRKLSSGDIVVRFNFKNGTDDETYKTYGIFGSDSGEVPLSTFVENLGPLGVSNLQVWCDICDNNSSRGCQFIAASSSTSHYDGKISPVGAGFLGAGLTIVVFAALLALGMMAGMVNIGKRVRPKRGVGDDQHGMDTRSTTRPGVSDASDTESVRKH